MRKHLSYAVNAHSGQESLALFDDTFQAEA